MRRQGVTKTDGTSIQLVVGLIPFFGYALYKAWLTVTQHERLLLDAGAWDARAMMLTHLLTSAAFCLCSLAIFLAMRGRDDRLLDHRALHWLGAALMAAGTLLGAAGGNGWLAGEAIDAAAGLAAATDGLAAEAPGGLVAAGATADAVNAAGPAPLAGVSLLFVILGGLLAGAGSALAFTLWGELYASLGHRWVRACSLAQLAVPALFAAVALLPYAAVLAVAVLLAIGCFASLPLALGRRQTFSAAAGRTATRVPTRPNAPVVAGVAIICLGYGFLQTTLTVNVGPGSSTVAYVVLALAVAFAVALLFFDRPDDPDYVRPAGLIVSLLVTGYLLYPVGSNQVVRLVSVTLVNSGFFLFEYLLVVALADVASHSTARPAVLFSGARVVVTGSVLAGMLLAAAALALVPDLRADRTASSLLVAVSVGLLAFAGIWLLSPRNLHRFFWGETKAPAAEADGTAGTLDRQCQQLARRYALTDRELDILRLWAQGRSVPYIQEALVISGSTVATHTRHIYQKCGVHSRQELLDLLGQG